jgi:hypothetical protein
MSPYQRHTPPEAEAALDELTLAKAEYLRRTVEIAGDLLMAIRACLDAGATWGEVGKRLGMSKQAARAHWGPHLDQMVAGERRRSGAADVLAVPAVPDAPRVPDVPKVLDVPEVPGVPDVPGVPGVPHVPASPGPG